MELKDWYGKTNIMTANHMYDRLLGRTMEEIKWIVAWSKPIQLGFLSFITLQLPHLLSLPTLVAPSPDLFYC